MKNIKKKIFFIAIFVLSILVLPISKPKNITSSASTKIPSYFYITTKNGPISDDLISIEKNKDNPLENMTYIYVEDTVTIGIKPFDYRYELPKDEDISNNFYRKATNIEISKDSQEYINYLNDDKEYKYLSFYYPITVYNADGTHFIQNKQFYFRILIDTITPPKPDGGEPYTIEYIKIYENQPMSVTSTSILSTLQTNAVRFFNNEDSLVIEITDSYTLKSFKNNTETSINIPVYSWASNTPSNMNMVFVKAPVRFANQEEDVVEFNTFKDLDPSTNTYKETETDNWLQKEQSFTKVSITFLTNTYEYSESNPLYFNINFNGFLYEYRLYSKDGYLFVTYIDEIRYNTAIEENDEEEKQKAIFNLATSSDLSKVVGSSQTFSMTFTYRGRYNFEVYDNTYVYGIKEANYYSTSFYVKDDSASQDEYITFAKENSHFMELFARKNPNATPAKVFACYENFYDNFVKNPANRSVVEQINKAVRVNIAININEFKNAFNLKYPKVSESELEELQYSFYDEFISDRANNADIIDRIETLAVDRAKSVYINTAKQNITFKAAYDAAHPDLTDEKVIMLYNDFYNLFLTDEYYTTEQYLTDENYKNSTVTLGSYKSIIDSIDYATKTNLLFNNIYILSQTIDDNNKPIKYIVNNATLNNSVLTTIKNLSDFGIEGITLSDVISKIDVTYTEFGTNNNIVTTTTHSIEEIEEFIEKNGEYFLSFGSDGYYQVKIYNRNKTKVIDYNFTIVKLTKVNYTIDGITYTADRMYYTDTRNYSKFINNKDPLTMVIGIDTIDSTNETALNITFENKYQITYGVIAVDISFSFNEEDPTIMYISFKGVGDLQVSVEVNGVTTNYVFNSEKGRGSLTVQEYGVYKVTLKDNMGTFGSNSYNFAKKMNTSSLVLIVLSSILGVFIAAFIFMVRGRVKTR